MKKLCLMLFGLLLPLMCSAGFLGGMKPYNPSYGMGVYMAAEEQMANGDYEAALNGFFDAAAYGYSAAYETIGLCYELGIGTERDIELADLNYEIGAEKGNYACKKAIRRINRNGHYSPSYRSTFLRNFVAAYNAKCAAAAASSYGGVNSSSSSSSSGNSSSNCSKCGGTGWEKTRYQNATGTYYYNSPGSRCPVCGYSDKHYHYRCYH